MQITIWYTINRKDEELDMKHYIDLHMHSMHSDDGEFSPSTLVKYCCEAGIKIMAIADHNSIKAIDEEQDACVTHGITCIPAIEVDCTFQDINLHVLGYGIDHTNKKIIALEDNVYRQEVACSDEKLTLTNAMGFELNKADMQCHSSNGVWTGELFAEVLLNDERYTTHPLLKPYREHGSRSDNPYVNFYWDYYSQGKPCYTEIIYPSLEETIAIIKKSGGVAVLAHPGNNLKGRFEVFDAMVQLGIQGVEAFSSYHNSEDEAYFYQKGLQYNLLITSGSDFHGKTKPSICLGYPENDNDQTALQQQLKDYKLI